MGYLGRRIGLSQDKGDSNPGADGGAVGGGILDLFANEYFERQGKIYNDPGAGPSPAGHTATGGIISDYTSGPDVYRAHIFTSSGTFDVTAIDDSYPANIEYLVIAGGGGGGGGYYAGGGGAGGVRTNLSGHPLATGNPSFAIATNGGDGSGSYTVTVGGGGGGGARVNPGPNGYDGTNGVDSYFGPPSTPSGITAKGGGRGLGRATSEGSATDGYPGGSGGGIAYRGPAVGYGYNPSTPSPIVPNIPSSHPYGITQGNPGGNADSSSKYGSGGGGAGAAGGNAGSSPPYGADGGAGVQIAIAGPTALSGVGAINPGPGESQWFAGGGAGGSDNSDRVGGVGGGGRAGRINTPYLYSEPGQAGTGGGGGGGCDSPNPGPRSGGDGGSGIVIIRYKIASVSTQKATGGAISYYGGKTIHTFNSNGTFTTTSDWNAGTNEVEYVCVGGGGGGGGTDPNCWGAGGGGAGQMRTGTTTISHPSPVSIAIGAGGRGTIEFNGLTGTNGSNTTVAFPAGTVTGYGGGLGASNAPSTGQTSGADGTNHPNTPVGSGSGGGANKTNSSSAGGGGPSALGAHPGGSMPGGNHYCGAGGGGAGGAGGRGSDASGNRTAPQIAGDGLGGIGLQAPPSFRNPAVTFDGVHTDAQWYLAGGGGGGLFNPNTAPATSVNPDKGGKGGGGYGGSGFPGQGTGVGTGGRGGNGLTGTGGGGGGSGSYNDSTLFTGGNGGSGLVLIAYPT